MKKLFLILFILLFGSTAWAFNPFVVFSGVPASSGPTPIVYVDCSQTNGEAVNIGTGTVTANAVGYTTGYNSVVNAAVVIDANNDVYSFSANETDGTLDPALGTITFYYKHTADVSSGMLFGQNSAFSTFRCFRNGTGNEIYFMINNDNAAFTSFSSDLWDGNWHTIRFTWNHSTGTRVLYVDDISSSDNVAQPNNWTDAAINSGSMKIGARSDGLFASKASFQDFKIYNTVITP